MKVAAAAADEKKAEDVVALYVREAFGITDYFIIASGQNDRQVRTIIGYIEERLREVGRRPLRREGVTEAEWALLDYGDFVVHVFLDEVRKFYDLERLWSDAPRVEWEEEAGRAGVENRV